MAIDAARAKSLFLNASDLADPAERAAYLERECGDNAELRDRVEALLRANDDSPLPQAGLGAVTIDSDPGRPDPQATGARVPSLDLDPSPVSITAHYAAVPQPNVLIAGRYTLQEKIGEGGMGEVWVAKQSEPVKRKVALKLIKPGMDSRAVLARFEQERQALAMMDHPNIAKVLDAGLTPNGQPFFVMELVNGLPLNKFCDEGQLKTNERLELFATICQAVQHAHQKGIVHRDLKPANILVTIIDGKPVPKVIDFGVAKATAGKLTDESMSTQFGAVVGTLEYMSPEQAGFSGEDIDTRADIYSLGVILYELLTGLRPIDAARLKKAALTEMIRIIREEEPSKPSTRLSTDGSLPSTAAQRQIEPRKLMAMLRGDLDWVVMKCLEKHRERRYETANALARDVLRYLNGDAVEACPPSVGYRLGKFFKRNKGPVLASGFVFLALVAGFIGTAWGLVRADQARQAEATQRKVAVEEKKKAELGEELAINAVKKFRDAVANNPELKSNPTLEPLRKTLLKEPLAFFKALRDRLQADRDTRPESLARLAAASTELGYLTREIGDKQNAVMAHREALAIRQRLADAHSDVTDFQRDLGSSHNNLGAMLTETGQPAEARASLEAGLAIRKRLADAHPSETLYQDDLANSHNSLGILLRATGHPAEARTSLGEALAVRQRLAAANPDVTDYQGELAKSHNNLGAMLTETGQPAEARASYEAALAILQRLADAHPEVTKYQVDLALSHGNLGYLLAETGHLTEARAPQEAGLAIRQRLADAHPSVTDYQAHLASSHNNLGLLLDETGHPAEARASYEAALAIKRRLADAHPSVTQFKVELAGSHVNLGVLLAATGHPAEARASYEAALAILQRLDEDHPSVTEQLRYLATGHNNLGSLLADTGHPAEARASFEAALAIRRRLADAHPESSDYASGLGNTLSNLAALDLDARQFAAAPDRLREAIAWQSKALTSYPRNPHYRRLLRRHYTNLLTAARGLGDADMAAEAERGLAGLDATDPRLVGLDARLAAVLKGEAPKDNAERLDLARRAYDTSRHAAAAGLWGEALAADPKLGDDRQARHRYNAACTAAMAASGQGKDVPKPDDTARAKLRKQALDWLKAELSDWKRVSMIIEPGNKETVAKTLTHWKQDTDLAGIRDTQELAKLPEAERKEWQALWGDVETLLKRTGGPKS